MLPSAVEDIEEIISRLSEGAHLYSFDQDADAERNVVANPNFTFVCSNFRYLKNWMRYYGVEGLDGLLADLGVSSHHFDDETRGFSFRFDSPLDMRMNKRAGKTAADIVNEYEEEALADIFYLYGELKNSRRIASALVKARAASPIKTTKDFMAAVEPLFKREREKKEMAKLLGTAHRGESRDGCPERDAPLCHRTAQAGRKTLGDYLSLTGRPHREEHDEGGQSRGQGRTGLLRKNRDAFQARQQQGNHTRRR